MTSTAAAVAAADSGASSPQEEQTGERSQEKNMTANLITNFTSPHHHAKRLLRFVHPHTGKTTIICPTPEEVARNLYDLRRQESKNEEEFDVLLRGSPEHMTALHDLHTHHENQRSQLREEHADIFERFEHVRNELDAISNELHTLTEHAVTLDASFAKFGYSAHLRTKDDSDSSSLSLSQHSSARKDHKDRSTNPLKFFKRPEIRQYFHKGLVWRSSRSGQAASFELFMDLIYVGIVDIIGENAAHSPDGLSLLHFIIVFAIAWKVRNDLTYIINWFEIDDIFQRISMLFYLVCLLGFTLNISYFFETTYTSAIAFYIAQRCFSGIWFLIVMALLPTIRGMMIFTVIVIAASSAVWIASIHVTWPCQIGVIFAALAVDYFGHGLMWLIAWPKPLLPGKKSKPNAMRLRLQKHFEFIPAINIEHRVERNDGFIALVFGYSVLAILFQSRSSFGVNAFFGKAVLGLIQAFCFNWIYFEIDNYGIHVHAIRRHWFAGLLWSNCHLPFIMGYILAASTLSRLVLAHDCVDADPETLGEDYVEESVGQVDHGLRWFYCCGLGIALIFMAIISASHTHKKLPKARLTKRPRLELRVCIAITIMCLPLAKSLTSLQLIATTTSLVVCVLCLDLFGNTCQGDPFWLGGFRHDELRDCTYTSHCPIGKRRRRELQKAYARGEKVGVADVIKPSPSASSFGGDTLHDGDP